MPETMSDFPNLTDNDTIHYSFIGNFIPPEWRELKRSDGKRLSKTSIQLLSLIVYLIGNEEAEELQLSYLFFEKRLGVCQRRVRQCFVELEESGFVSLNLASVITRHNIKYRNVLCIKLTKKFQRNQKKVSGQSEKNFRYTIL